jgi:hypothetical protein
MPLGNHVMTETNDMCEPSHAFTKLAVARRYLCVFVYLFVLTRCQLTCCQLTNLLPINLLPINVECQQALEPQESCGSLDEDDLLQVHWPRGCALPCP